MGSAFLCVNANKLALPILDPTRRPTPARLVSTGAAARIHAAGSPENKGGKKAK